MKHVYMKLQLILSICVLFAFIFTACSVNGVGIGVGAKGPVVKKGPPPHAPAYGYRAKYTYYYYPNAYVYFDVSRRLYFYLEGDKWSVSVSLPHSMHVHLGEHVTLEMDSDKPYTHFNSHKKKFPPGHLKKKKKWAKSKKNSW